MASEFLHVAEIVLRRNGRPMSAQEITQVAINEKLFSDNIAGQTPEQTMKSKLSVHIRTLGNSSKFVRTEAGRFYLRSLLASPTKIYEAPPLSKSIAGEKVLIFPADHLDRYGRFQGIKRKWRRIHKETLRIPVCTYKERLEAEHDDQHKQVLTYILVRRGSEILAFRRGSYSGIEQYLRGRECVGFGGHVCEDDRDLLELDDLGVHASAIRELSEELRLPAADIERLKSRNGLNIIGILNDDSSPVGRRHMAFVFEYEVSEAREWNTPERGEKSVTQLRWIDLNHASFSLRDFEYWSQLCLREYCPGVVSAQPSFRITRKRPLQPPHILCVLGMVGSGKSELTEVLKADFGYREINSGKLVAKLIGLPPIPDTRREEFQLAAWKFISQPEGPAKLAGAILDQLDSSMMPGIVVDGIRQRATIEALRDRAQGKRVATIYVQVPPDVAYEFYQQRERADITIQEFLTIRNAPVEDQVENMIDLGDAIVYNWAGRLQFRQVARDLMRAAQG